MGARQKQWAKQARQRLLAELGGVCVLCDKRNMKTKGRRGRIEFDVIIPVDGGRHHTFDTSQRICFYRQQHRAGNLQLLCSYHNAQKANKEKLFSFATATPPVDDNNPF